MANFQKFKYNKSSDTVSVTLHKQTFVDKELVTKMRERLDSFGPYVYDLVPLDVEQVEKIVVENYALSLREDDAIGVKVKCKVYYPKSEEPFTFTTPVFYLADSGEQLLPKGMQTEITRAIEETDAAIEERNRQGELDFDANGDPKGENKEVAA